VGRGEVGKGGVVRDPEKHIAVIESIGTLAKALNLETVGVTESPITGPKGNREFLVYLKKLY
jgi:23S rRNA (cytidine1920-2'-O)/16S rRNA (cytidine1409-2'-O)-methyltransferase